jgi:hypothetical protein
MYAALLEEALGSGVDVICPSSREDSEASGEFSAEPFLPRAWNRILTPSEPAMLLAAVADVISQSTNEIVFVLTPWLSYRELPDDVRAVHGRLGLHEIALLIAAERAAPGTTISALVPYPTVAADVSRPFRAEFFIRARPSLVLTHDGLAGEIGLHSQFRTATIVATTHQEGGVTRFFKVTEDCPEEDVLADLKRLLTRGGGATEYGYVVRDRLPPGSSLSHDLRSPELTNAKLSLEHLGELKRLEEVFDVQVGLNAALEKHRLVDVETGGDAPLLIEGRSIRRGTIAWDLARYRAKTNNQWLLRPGDVLVRALAAPSDERLTVAEFPDAMPPACAASTVVILRPRLEVTPEQIRVAVQYLSSRLAMRVVRALGGGGVPVSGPLRRILVPVPDEDLNLAIRELGEAAAQFSAWAEEAEQARSDVFERVGPEEWRAQILRAGARVRERERAARQVEDLGFRVRTLFPHPLAHLWRVVEASPGDYDGYKTVLETTETLLMYAAVLALVGARAVDEPVPWADVIAGRLSTSPERGVNMGDWLSIVSRAAETMTVTSGDLSRRSSSRPTTRRAETWRRSSRRLSFSWSTR